MILKPIFSSFRTWNPYLFIRVGRRMFGLHLCNILALRSIQKDPMCASMRGVLLGRKKVLSLIIKLWLIFRSRYLILWLLGTYSLWEFEQETSCARGRYITSKICCAPYLKYVALFFYCFSKSSSYLLVFF